MDSFGTLAQRMRSMADDLERDGLSRRELSATAKKSHAWLNSVINGDSKSPEAIPLARLCETYGYNVRWLLTGLGPKMIDRRDDERAARERGEPAPAPRGTQADEAARRLLEGRPAPKTR